MSKSNQSQIWTDAVKGFVNSSSIFTDDNGVLQEVACERNAKCDTDQRAFKGITARSLGRAAQAAPIVTDSIYKTLNATAKAAAASCEDSGNDVACNLYWSSKGIDSSRTAAGGNLGEVLNALQAVQALLWHTVDFSNLTSGSTSPNATTSGSPSGTSGAPQSTGAGSIVAASATMVLAVAFAAALSY